MEIELSKKQALSSLVLLCCWSGETRGDCLGQNEIACQSWALYLHSSIYACSALGRWKVYSWKEMKVKKPTFAVFLTRRDCQTGLVILHPRSVKCYFSTNIKKKIISDSILRVHSLQFQRPLENRVQLLFIVVLYVDKTSTHFSLFSFTDLLLKCHGPGLHSHGPQRWEWVWEDCLEWCFWEGVVWVKEKLHEEVLLTCLGNDGYRGVPWEN